MKSFMTGHLFFSTNITYTYPMFEDENVTRSKILESYLIVDILRTHRT